jgi:hypothetical protein
MMKSMGFRGSVLPEARSSGAGTTSWGIGLREVLPLVGMDFFAEQRED